MAKPLNVRDGVCPFIDLNDPRCDARFSLSRIDQAFHVCLSSGHTRCPTYYQLAASASGFAPTPPGYPGHPGPLGEGPTRDAHRPPAIRLTVHGRTVTRATGGPALRPTGS